MKLLSTVGSGCTIPICTSVIGRQGQWLNILMKYCRSWKWFLPRICLPSYAGKGSSFKEWIYSLWEKTYSWRSVSSFGKLLSSGEASMKSQKLFPFVKRANKTYRLYTFSLICFNYPIYSVIRQGFLLCLRDDTQGAIRFAPVCPSVCPSVHHTLRYRVCVINSSHSF